MTDDKFAVGVVAMPDADLEPFLMVASVFGIDAEGLGEKRNHRETLETLRDEFPDAQWYVLLEDDAVLCADFEKTLEATLDDTPPGAQVLSLYLGTGRWASTNPDTHKKVVEDLIRAADSSGARWIEGTGMWHAVAMVFSRDVVDYLIHWMGRDPSPTDEAVTDWCVVNNRRVYYSWPSLVDHKDVGMKSGVPRRAYRVVD